MNNAERQIREAICTEARTWLRTPYHHMADVRGVGVDCSMLLVRVYQAVGAAPLDLDPRPYPFQFNLHKGHEFQLEFLDKYAYRIQEPQSGDIVTWKVARSYSHVGIIMEWPDSVIHSNMVAKMVEESRGDAGFYADRDHLFYSPKMLRELSK